LSAALLETLDSARTAAAFASARLSKNLEAKLESLLLTGEVGISFFFWVFDVRTTVNTI
jgi:hypothetical protein